MKRILLLTTGGTIASVETKRGLAPAPTSEPLRRLLDELALPCEVTVHSLFHIDSTNFQPEHWLEIARAIRRRIRGIRRLRHHARHRHHGLHGRGALLPHPVLRKAHRADGAQRPLSDAITDARRNLRDSIRFALHEGVRGVYLVFDGKAILGTRARKVRSKSYNAFESINYPVAAFIDERRILQYMEAPCAAQPGVQFTTRCARVCAC